MDRSCMCIEIFCFPCNVSQHYNLRSCRRLWPAGRRGRRDWILRHQVSNFLSIMLCFLIGFCDLRSRPRIQRRGSSMKDRPGTHRIAYSRRGPDWEVARSSRRDLASAAEKTTVHSVCSPPPYLPLMEIVAWKTKNFYAHTMIYPWRSIATRGGDCVYLPS